MSKNIHIHLPALLKKPAKTKDDSTLNDTLTIIKELEMGAADTDKARKMNPVQLKRFFEELKMRWKSHYEKPWPLKR